MQTFAESFILHYARSLIEKIRVEYDAHAETMSLSFGKRSVTVPRYRLVERETALAELAEAVHRLLDIEPPSKEPPHEPERARS